MATSVEQRERLALRGIEAYNAGNAAGMVAALADDVEVFASLEMANAGRYHGHEGFLSWIQNWTDAWDDIVAEVTEMIPVGERHVVAALHQTGRGRSGIEVSMDLAFLFEIQDDGLCSYLAMLPDAEEAVRLAREREAGS
jgi:ketosteroid isomerase-like protein